jgi:hypothetical protein
MAYLRGRDPFSTLNLCSDFGPRGPVGLLTIRCRRAFTGRAKGDIKSGEMGNFGAGIDRA